MQRLEGDFGVMGGAVKAEDVSVANGHDSHELAYVKFWSDLRLAARFRNFWSDLQLAARFSNKEFAKETAGILIQQLMEDQFHGGVMSQEIVEQMHQFVDKLNWALVARGFKQSLGTLVLTVDEDSHGISLQWAEG